MVEITVHPSRARSFSVLMILGGTRERREERGERVSAREERMKGRETEGDRDYVCVPRSMGEQSRRGRAGGVRLVYETCAHTHTHTPVCSVRVQARRWFIEKENRGLCDEFNADGHTLLLTCTVEASRYQLPYARAQGIISFICSD